METRRLLICTAFFLLAVLSSCSEGRHSMKRAAEDYTDMFADGGATDDEAQNDADADQDEDTEVPGNIMTHSMTYNVTIGKAVRLECKITPEGATGVVTWTRGDTQLFIGSLKTAAPERYSIAPRSHDLVIMDVADNDTAEYECKLEQTNPQAIQHKLIVHESPRIVNFTATDNGRVAEGADLLLTCDVAGLPPPQITWSKVGEDGSNEKLTERDGEFSNNRVFIRNVQKHHSGTYYCYAFNPSGHNEAALSVTVLGKPRVHTTRTIVNSGLNIPALLECSVHDEKPVQIKWYKDGRLVSGSPVLDISTDGSMSNLTVSPASSEDFGNYTCVAENEYGRHSQSITLVQKPVVEGLSVYGPKLSWTVHSHQPLEQIEIQLLDDKGVWHKLDVVVPEGQAKKYEITYDLDQNQLEPGKYTAFVKVKNSNDWGENDGEVPVEIADRPQPVQRASMFGGNNGHSMRPAATTAVSTILMYLLVRML